MQAQLEANVPPPSRRLWLVREGPVPPRVSPGSYEREGSERVSRGSIALPSGARWLSVLEVPISGGPSALLTIRREGPTATLPDEATLALPPEEADALLALLQGLVAQARSDGVLEDTRMGEPERRS